MSLTNKVNFDKQALVVITGASRGIGATIAVNLAKQLHQKSIFLLLARSEEGLAKTKNEISEIDKLLTVITHKVDFSQPDLSAYETLFEDSLKQVDLTSIEYGLIFHNAGTVGDLKQTTDLLDLKTWQSFFDVNLHSAVLLNGVFIKKLRPLAPQLVVVNITSLAGRSPIKNLAAYGAAKAARDLFFKVLAEEEPRIIVLNYSPGPVNTDMFTTIIHEAQSEEIRKTFRETSVLQPDQTVDKLLDLLARGEFTSGATIDYYDL